MKAAFFIVMNDIPNAKFKNLQAWSHHMGIAEIVSFHNCPRATHDSPTSFNEVHISMCIFRMIVTLNRTVLMVYT